VPRWRYNRAGDPSAWMFSETFAGRVSNMLRARYSQDRAVGVNLITEHIVSDELSRMSVSPEDFFPSLIDVPGAATEAVSDVLSDMLDVLEENLPPPFAPAQASPSPSPSPPLTTSSSSSSPPTPLPPLPLLSSGARATLFAKIQSLLYNYVSICTTPAAEDLVIDSEGRICCTLCENVITKTTLCVEVQLEVSPLGAR